MLRSIVTRALAVLALAIAITSATAAVHPAAHPLAAVASAAAPDDGGSVIWGP